MINRNKKGIIVLMALFVAVLMIGIPVSAAATPSTPSYLASGNSMNYVYTCTGYTYYHNYSKDAGMPETTTNNVTASPVTTYYNVTVDTANSTAVNITLPIIFNGPGMTTVTNASIDKYAKYAIPRMVKNTSKNITINDMGTDGYYIPGGQNSYNMTLNYTKAPYMPYYKSEFGSVEATDYVIYMTSSTKATPSLASSYANITGNVYISKANNMLIGYTLTTTTTHVTSGTTAANETYTITSTTESYVLASTNAIPIHTDYTGAYVGIVVAAVLLGVVVYYFYARKPATPKTTEKKEAESKEEDNKTK
jgi:hypothetical protein